MPWLRPTYGRTAPLFWLIDRAAKAQISTIALWHTSKCIPQTPPTPERTTRSPHFKCSLLELVLPIPLHSLKLNLGQLRASSVIPQPTIHLIPRSYRADTRRRAGQDHITRLDETEMLATRQGLGGVGRGCENYGNQWRGICPGISIRRVLASRAVGGTENR